MNLPFKIDLSNKVAVVTGGGGILCSNFAKVIAECGAKVAILSTGPERDQTIYLDDPFAD